MNQRLMLAQRLIQRLNKRTRRGFTLIELLVVVVIIGILASIALPSFVGAQDKARNSAVQGGLSTIRLGLETYGTDHNGAYPTSALMYASTSTVVAPGFLQNNYVPGNKIPKSPWGTVNPTVNSGSVGTLSGVVAPAASTLVAAASVAAGCPMPVAGGRFTISGAMPAPGTQPTLFTQYGAFFYDNAPASQTYAFYASGKDKNQATLVGEGSNMGN